MLGVGCQRMAFNRLGIDVEMVGISEIDKYAIQSYMAIHGETKNFGDITKINGNDLPQIDVFTYSFPCTDLSKAGKQKGLNETRSGLVYEVLRILHELDNVNRLPKVLIMENVVDLVQVKFIKQFQEIQLELEQLGYSNYTETMNAKDYGVAQNRDRVFMVSILGDYYYEFPKPFKLEKRLKDYLETSVDEKYYLSEKLISCLSDITDRNGFVRGERFNPRFAEEFDYAYAITTKAGGRTTDNFIKDNSIIVKENNSTGYDVAVEGDCINVNQPNSKTRRGRVGHQVSQTLTTQQELVVVEPKMRIRKLTPRETGRLMGLTDEEITKQLSVVSNSQAYKQHGNGIVVDVFAAILKQMKGD